MMADIRSTIFVEDNGDMIRVSSNCLNYFAEILRKDCHDEASGNLVLSPRDSRRLAETLFEMADDCDPNSEWYPYPMYIPDTPTKYFITVESSSERFVEIDEWTGWEFNSIFLENDGCRKLIAWRPIPEPKPYRGE